MNKATLQEIASQLSCPEGENGIAAGEKMNSSNDFITQKTIEHLAPKQGENIVEIGPGNGMLSLPILDALGAQGRYFGIDQSADMARVAKANLQQQACLDVHVVCCDFSEAEIEEGSIDGLLAVNVLYFIDDLPAFFAHIKQWLKPNGRAVFGVRSPETLNALPFTQYGFNIRTIEAMKRAMTEAGFNDVESTQYDEGMSSFEDIELPVDSVIIKGFKS
ncbi:MAG: SAM-dependent methyltransferase [Pseudomonadales bacterium]